SGLLLAVGGIGVVLARRTLGGAGAVLVAALAGVSIGRAPLTAPNVRYVGSSFYGELKVVDIAQYRSLLIDGVDNGFVERASMEPRAPYISAFDYLPAVRPAATR